MLPIATPDHRHRVFITGGVFAVPRDSHDDGDLLGIADRVADGKNPLEIAVDESLVDYDRPLRRLCIGLADVPAGDYWNPESGEEIRAKCM